MTLINLDLASRCLQYNIGENIPSFLWGPPGIGKSQCVAQVADRMGYGLIDIRLSLRDPVDLRGLPLVDARTSTTRWLSPAELPQLKRDGKNGILFLDECNSASTAMQSAAMGLVLDRKLGEYNLPKGWVPVAAGNRMLDRAAAQRMGTALKNRFAHFEVGFDLEAWIKWAEEVKLSPLMVGWAKWRPGLMHVMPQGEENSFPTPRAWEQVAKLIEADEDIRQHLVAALVGDGPAAEFEAFARVYAKLPSIKVIKETPGKAKIPDLTDPGIMYALAAALARHADKQSFGNILIYAGRLESKEYEVLIATDAVKRKPELKETKAFSTWIVKNQEVLV